MKFKSSLLAQASGSVGGSTYSRNRYGAYIRNRAVPVNPSSPQQIAVRGYFAQLASLWSSTLAASQRDAWELYGANVPLVDKLGDPVNCNGLCHYIRSNVPRLQAGLPRVDDGPTVFDLGPYTPVNALTNVTLNAVDVSFTDTDAWCDEDDSALLVSTSRSMSNTINFFKGPFRYAGKIDGDSTTPPTSPATNTAAFAVTVFNATYVRVAVSRADGRLSLPQIIRTITISV